VTHPKSLTRASYLARFGYIGTTFHGLQPNKGHSTAGGALLDLVTNAAGMPPRALQFSARTDAGVHALENYATFWFPRPFDHDAFLDKLKSARHPLLYVDVKQVPFWIHARANAHGKWYRYVIEDACVDLESNNAWRVAPGLDVDTMQEAAKYLVGTHAFDAFRHGGCTANSTVKTITRIDVVRVGRQIHVDIRGTGFLRRMVRIIVGTLAQVGAGLRVPGDMKDILESRRRYEAGPSAPAAGLTLMSVEFTLSQP
jgi:tRNA pseudouridine38-40 synthase